MGKFLVSVVAVCLGLIVFAQAEPPVPSLDLQAPGPIESFGFTYSNSIPESPSRPASASSSSAAAPIPPIAQQVPVQDSYQPAPPAAYPSQQQQQQQQVYYETIPSSSNQYYHTYQPQQQLQVVYGPPPTTTTTTTTQRPLVVYGPPARYPQHPPRQGVYVPARYPLRTTTPNPIYLPPTAPTTTTTTTQRPALEGYSYNKPQGPQITYGPPRVTVPVAHQVSYHPQPSYTFVRPSRFSYIPNRYQYVPLTTSYGY